MTKKRVVYVSFSADANFSTKDLKHQLTNLKRTLNTNYGNDNYEVYLFNPSETICREKDYLLDAPDIFKEVFKTVRTCELVSEPKYDALFKKDAAAVLTIFLK